MNQPLNQTTREGIPFLEVPMGVCVLLRSFAKKRLRDCMNAPASLIEKFGEAESLEARAVNRVKTEQLQAFLDAVPKWMKNSEVWGEDHLSPELAEQAANGSPLKLHDDGETIHQEIDRLRAENKTLRDMLPH